MGQQLNKIQKRRRRAAYLERQKIKAKTRTVSKPAAPVAKKKPAAKKEKAPAAAAAPAAAEATAE